MKLYTFKGRNSSASAASGSISAENRSDAMQQLSQKGIIVLSLIESTPDHVLPKGGKILIVGISSLILLLILVGVSFCLINSKHKGNLDIHTISSHTKQITGNRNEQKKLVNKQDIVFPSLSTQKGESAKGVYPKKQNAIPTHRNLPVPKPLEELTPPPKQVVFKTGSEQLLAMTIPVTPGNPVPPLPDVKDEWLADDLNKAMNNIIIVQTNDSENVVIAKENVAYLKDDFLTLNETEGWSFVEYLEALRKNHNDDAKFLEEAHKEFNDLWYDESVSDKDVKKRMDELNAELWKRGLPLLE